MPKREFSLYFDEDLIENFDNEIFPFKRSNVLTKLISDYLSKNSEGKSPQSKPAKVLPKGGHR